MYAWADRTLTAFHDSCARVSWARTVEREDSTEATRRSSIVWMRFTWSAPPDLPSTSCPSARKPWRVAASSMRLAASSAAVMPSLLTALTMLWARASVSSCTPCFLRYALRSSSRFTLPASMSLVLPAMRRCRESSSCRFSSTSRCLLW